MKMFNLSRNSDQVTAWIYEIIVYTSVASCLDKNAPMKFALSPRSHSVRNQKDSASSPFPVRQLVTSCLHHINNLNNSASKLMNGISTLDCHRDSICNKISGNGMVTIAHA